MVYSKLSSNPEHEPHPQPPDKCRFFTLRLIIGLDLADKEGKWTRRKEKEERRKKN
jgi:hypothetical protein